MEHVGVANELVIAHDITNGSRGITNVSGESRRRVKGGKWSAWLSKLTPRQRRQKKNEEKQTNPSKEEDMDENPNERRAKELPFKNVLSRIRALLGQLRAKFRLRNRNAKRAEKEEEPKKAPQDAELKELNPIQRFAYAKISERLPTIKGYREIYEQSGMGLVYESYFSTAILVSGIITLPTFLISLLLEVKLLHDTLLFAFVGSVILGGIVFSSSLGLWLIYPMQKRRVYKTKLDNGLAYSMGILGVLAASGMGIERLFEKLIPTESNPVLADLASRIIRNIRIFGFDTEAALRETAEHTPSRTFASMLYSMAVAFKTTGTVTELILYESARLFQEKRQRLRKIINSLSLMAELYITVVVVGPILFIVMMSIFGLLPSAGLPDPILLINIIVFVAVPLIAIVFLILLDSTVSTI